MNNLFGILIKDLREAAGLTQVDFAKKLNMSQSSLSKIENGRLNPPVEIFIVCARMSTSVSGPILQRFTSVIWGAYDK